MRPRSALVPLFALLAGLGTFAAAYTRPKPAPQPAAEPPPGTEPRVRLAVLVVFDQMRGDFLERWKPLFGPGGFARLQGDGAWFTRCYYPYATTTTGPGHASILTGTCPDRHGIINNNWSENGRSVYCATEERYAPVPPPAGRARPAGGGSPGRLLSESVADVLKQTYGPRARVFGLSLKDRSAILPTGKTPDGAFWFDGRLVTSTYYTDALERRVPGWVTAFNQDGVADRWFGKDWTRLRPDLDYAAYSGPDDAPGEGTGQKQGRTFPHPTTGGAAQPGGAYYAALANSPYGNDLLLEVARRCVAFERLGRDRTPDLLTISFSSNDLIGHTWGPDSQEVLDVTLRSDVLMGKLLGFLDQQVGKDRYVLAVTADHGSCPLPEVSVSKGREAARVDIDALRAGAEQHLRAKFGDPSGAKAGPAWIDPFLPPWFYLNPNLVRASGRSRAEVARSLADYLAAQPHVYRTFTRDQLAGGFPERDEIDRRVRRSFHPARSGDVYLVLNPFDLPYKPGSTGSTHGSPHGYDASAPLLVYGPGIPGGPRTEAVTPQAMAAIFARFLGIRPPADADFPVPASLEGK